jgi:hypothetical protein
VPDGPVPHIALHGRTDADLDHPLRINQTFLDCVVEDGTMGIGLTEIIGSGVDMSIEMNQRDRLPQAAP